MQNKEEEKRIREDFKNQFKNKILRISNHTPEAFDLIDDLQSFISQEIEKAYQKGKEETLEEVERMIKEKASLKTEDKVVDIAILLFSEDILQTLNKMKEHERHN
jgi:hypothetical protein